MSEPPIFIEAQELHQIMTAQAALEVKESAFLTILDASWHLPGSGRDAKAEYDAGHIPGAVFFDIDTISDPDSHLPHMLPSAELFAAQMEMLGISNDDHIVVYDSLGLFSAPRARWMLQIMGASHVQILKGGLPAWQQAGQKAGQEAGYNITAAIPPRRNARFRAQLADGRICVIDDVRQAICDHQSQILDARPQARFMGAAPEPRPGLRAGHMPEALSLPASLLIENGGLKAEKHIRAILQDKGVTLEAPIITSCGSGVTAAIISLALEAIGYENHRLYDGSWAEWGASDTDAQRDNPVKTNL